MDPCSAQPGLARPRLEVADIFRATVAAFREKHVPTRDQLKVMLAIMLCRTASLGGHLDVCKTCGHEMPAYNSCRNRHCPKCQSLPQARWLEQRRQRIIPTKYFHVVFTLPQELRSLTRKNPKKMYDLLLASAARTLLDFGRSRLHAQVGLTCVLHTWTRELHFHPHVHCIVTAGGLDDDGHWVPARSRFLFPVKAMSKVFRGKLLDGLAELNKKQKLTLEGHCADLAQPATFAKLLTRLYQKEWVVYAKQSLTIWYRCRAIPPAVPHVCLTCSLSMAPAYQSSRVLPMFQPGRRTQHSSSTGPQDSTCGPVSGLSNQPLQLTDGRPPQGNWSNINEPLVWRPRR
jgi:hypothetical protein